MDTIYEVAVQENYSTGRSWLKDNRSLVAKYVYIMIQTFHVRHKSVAWMVPA